MHEWVEKKLGDFQVNWITPLLNSRHSWYIQPLTSRDKCTALFNRVFRLRRHQMGQFLRRFLMQQVLHKTLICVTCHFRKIFLTKFFFAPACLVENPSGEYPPRRCMRISLFWKTFRNEISHVIVFFLFT